MIEATLDEYVRAEKTFGGKTKTVYRRGDTGPGVLLMHEIPGITPKLLGLGKVISDAGFRVAIPSLFGTDGAAPGPIAEVAQVLRMCINAEFNVWAGNGSSPVVDWLRELCKDVAAETGGPVGAIGLCITGGFALSLTVGTDGVVRAPVMSEPSLPFGMPGFSHGADLHLTPAERDEIHAAAAPPVMGLRFTSDSLCPKARFDAYADLLGPRFAPHRIEIRSPDPAFGIKASAHSVLTQHNQDAPPDHPTKLAVEQVLTFLRENLAQPTRTEP
ncbi:MAG TPA: dienelactone hydrolase family protein [Candidatus Limnocylindrales bacterium]|nr:dienelactone hydrolase family protein [Candidatus Limnocylindrales bacterium]